jgi:hypothetical protein
MDALFCGLVIPSSNSELAALIVVIPSNASCSLDLTFCSFVRDLPNSAWDVLTALNENLDKCAYYAAF